MATRRLRWSAPENRRTRGLATARAQRARVRDPVDVRPRRHVVAHADEPDADRAGAPPLPCGDPRRRLDLGPDHARRRHRLARAAAAYAARADRYSVVLNTSFNAPGEPIVCSPLDVLCTYIAMGLDAIIVGDLVLEKTQ
jgi:hypothetical protein